MNYPRVSIGGAVVLVGVITHPATADPVGLVAEDVTDSAAAALGLSVCQVSVEFDSSSDKLLSLAVSNVTTDDPAGFHQHPFGQDTAPGQQFVDVFPELAYDSFVTIGLAVVPTGTSDSTALDPDWDSSLFNNSGQTAGGWYNANPDNTQGVPDANLRVLIGQFTSTTGYNASGTVTVYYNDGTVGFAGSFDCGTAAASGGGGPAPAPGGPVPAGPAAGGGSQAGSGQPTFCGDPLAESCLVVHATPYCDCAPCCDLVCEALNSCCNVAWTQDCVDIAGDCVDCNDDDVPDSCQELDDCDDNGIPDECDTIIDCQPNGIPDECDIDRTSEEASSKDCNCNQVPDECDIASDPGLDTNTDGILDECQDCDNDGILDPDEIPPSLDCNGNLIPDECELAIRGPVFLSGHDADDIDHCDDAGECADVYPALINYILQNSLVTDPPGQDILIIGASGQAFAAFDTWRFESNPTNPPTFLVVDEESTPNISTVDFSRHSMIYIPSFWNAGLSFHTSGGITEQQLNMLNARRADIRHYVNILGGGVLALTQAFAPGAYGWLPYCVYREDLMEPIHVACPTDDLLNDVSGHTLAQSPDEDCHSSDCDGPCDDLSPDGPYHSTFVGPHDLNVLVKSYQPVNEALVIGDLVLGSLVDCDGNGVIDACEEVCHAADLFTDGQVNAFDSALLLGAWGQCPEECLFGEPNCEVCPADLNGDCQVSADDLAALLGAWGPCP